jgi:hypothetical protein
MFIHNFPAFPHYKYSRKRLYFQLKCVHRGLIAKYSIRAGVVPALAVHIIDKPDGKQVKVSHRKP